MDAVRNAQNRGQDMERQKWNRDLRQFSSWLEAESGTGKPTRHNFAGDKNTRRKIMRACGSFTKQLKEIRRDAPALQNHIEHILEQVHNLSQSRPSSTVIKSPLGKMRVWRDQIGIRQAISVDMDRWAKERKKELLFVTWMLAPVVSADIHIKNPAANHNSERAFYEWHRRLRKKHGGLVGLVEQYFEEFKMAIFRNAHSRKKLYRFRPLDESTRRLTSLSKIEIDSISKLCRRARLRDRRKRVVVHNSPAQLTDLRLKKIPPWHK
jgi:hypothetical protein